MNKENQIFLRKEGDIIIVDIKGDITAQSEPFIFNVYQKIEDFEKILFNFDESAYINSGGIAIIIFILAKASKKNQVIYMSGLSDHFKKIFHMVGITKYSKIYSTELEALKDF